MSNEFVSIRAKKPDPKQDKHRHRRAILVGVFVLIVAVIALFIYLLYEYSAGYDNAAEPKKELLHKSRYKEIKTRLYKNKDIKRDIFVEYPVTKYDGINKFVASIIDNHIETFNNETIDLPVLAQPYSEKISYQILYSNDKYITIALYELNNIYNNHELSQTTHSWTFDKKTQKQIKKIKNMFDVSDLDDSKDKKSDKYEDKSCDNCVAITYDDGPGPYTDELLDILDKYDIKASFLLVGRNVPKWPDAVKREYDEGHTVANHTWDHKDLTILSKKVYEKEVTKTNDAIKKVTGQVPTLLRPPYGSYDKKILKFLKGIKMSAVLWNVDTRDWKDHDSKIVCHRAVTSASKGAIILMHDIHETTVKAAPCVIKGLEKRGFKLVSLDKLLRDRKPGKAYFSGK